MNRYLKILSGVVICLLSSSIVHLLYASVDRRDEAHALNALQASRTHQSATDPLMSDSLDNIFWFIQITDLHLSIHQDASRITDFEKFCNYTVPTIRPEFVVVSGDITDARSLIYISSEQYLSEWLAYQTVLQKSGVLNVTKFYDIRGNHDMFDVLKVNHSSDYFSKYGVQGPMHKRSYIHTVRKPYGKYSFINLDACPKSGVNFPLNFFGELTLDEEKQLLHLVSKAEQSNHTFWFGHYPTSTITSSQLDLRALLGKSAFAYFCGHLHTVHELVPRMYVLQPQGYLELELGDWRDGRYFRVVAVDHDLVSFVDVRMLHDAHLFSEWPILLVTNPKDSNFLLPYKEPVNRIWNSTHIRVLVWSIRPILYVSIYIDGEFQGNATRATRVGTDSAPLFVLPWNATQWADRMAHQLQVVATDIAGNRRSVLQQFVINGEPTWNFAGLASVALHPNHSLNVQVVFYLLEGLLFCFFLAPRLIPSKFSSDCFRRCCFGLGLYRLTHFNPCYIPILCFIIYQCCGPTFMGFLIGYHFGVVFSFGILIGTTFMVESLTYVYEGIQFLIFVILYLPVPLWYFGKIHPSSSAEATRLVTTEDRTLSTFNRDPHDSALVPNTRVQAPVPIPCVGKIPVVLFIHAIIFTFLQFIFLIVTVGIPYGSLAALLSPGRLYPIALCWHVALRAKDIMTHTSMP